MYTWNVVVPARHHVFLLFRDHFTLGGKVTHRYESALLGFAAELPDSSVSAMTLHPHVHYVEPDGEVTAYAREIMNEKK